MKKTIPLFFAVFLFHSSIFAEHFLTFIMPCYNCQEWVEEAILSIYEQKNLECPFEIVCTDDGSSDSTYEILQKLLKTHPEIHIYKHEKNQGGATTRNTCVKHSQGDIIFCLDSDNVLVPNSVQLLIDHMDQTDSDVVAFEGPFYFSGNQTLTQIKYVAPNQTYTLYDLFNNSTTPPCSGNYLYTRESFDRVGGYPPQWCIDTMAFGYNQVVYGCKMTYVKNTYYWHRQGMDSYFVREIRSGRINLHFFEYWLSIKDVFTNETVQHLEYEFLRARNHEPFYDFIWFLDNQGLKLKK